MDSTVVWNGCYPQPMLHCVIKELGFP